MRSPTLAAGVVALASIAFAQIPIRYLMPLARYGHYASEDPKLIAENLRNHSKYLEGSVEELVRYLKSDPNLDPEARKTADDMLKWCREEKKLIDADAAKIGGPASGAAPAKAPEAAPADQHEGLIKSAPITVPTEPRFE